MATCRRRQPWNSRECARIQRKMRDLIFGSYLIYSTKKLQDVLKQFCEVKKQSPDGDIDFDGFQWFINTFLEVKAPDELCRHLFLSFVRKDKRPALREMAAASSAAACAAVTAHGDHQLALRTLDEKNLGWILGWTNLEN
ncbi:diacylglycerol kinase 1-like [Hyposmocoma kahamanoa]|uniref:diacylglycerol kinase 1-like n=1 Tax=Hyposmocoma kahamanoa TaxID=1477025 RepID=UPI000E6D60E5|nr:diacylglycerol kinase 1-like [Hyposmocoma kahamanoa]